MPLVYDQLRELAAAKLAHENPGQTLQATALVHEAYLRLVGPGNSPRSWDSHGHFFAAAAEAMRRILVDQARRKQAAKRPRGRVSLDDIATPVATAETPAVDLLTLDEALRLLEAEHPAKAELVRLELLKVNADATQLTNLRTLTGHPGTMRAVILTNDGRQLLTASEEEKTVKIRPFSQLAGYQRLCFPDECLMLLDDPSRAVTTKGGAITVRDLATGTAHSPYSNPLQSFRFAGLSSDRTRLVAASWKGELVVLDTRTWAVEHLLNAGGEIMSLALHPQGNLIATGNNSSEAVLWDLRIGEPVNRIKVREDGVNVGVTFSPDGTRFLAICEDHLLVRDLASQQQSTQVSGSPMRCLSVSPDGSLVAVGGDLHCSLWDLTSMRELDILSGHRRVNSVTFSPDGQTLATLGEDPTVRLWHIPTRRELLTLADEEAELRWVRFTADGRCLVATYNGDGEPNEVLVFDGSAKR